MAGDKQYKKRVISESESDGDEPLGASAAKSSRMTKTASNGSNHDPQTVAEGSALLKQAAGDAVGKVRTKSKSKYRDVPGFARR